MLSKQTITNLRKKHLSEVLYPSYKDPIMMMRGEMQYMFDEKGTRYLDAYNNVIQVGHCNPSVVKAAVNQISTLNTNTRYLHENIVVLAKELVETFPKPLEVCYFVNSGSEANDLAQRLAWCYTGNTESIVLENSYHGITCAAASLSHTKNLGNLPTPKYTHVVEVPDTYRGVYRKGRDENLGEKYAELVQKKIKEEIIGKGKKLSAFFVESIQGSGGQIVYPPNYLKNAFKYVRENGGLCVADEVQVGFGRCGDKFWAFETQGVVPDIVTMGKPMGNGFPVACVITTKEIANSFNKMEYFSTFGGNTVSCAVALEVLRVIKRDKLQENAKIVGNYLLDNFVKLQNKHYIIGDVRGMGLYVGIEFVRNRDTLEPAKEETGEGKNLSAYLLREFQVLVDRLIIPQIT
eukprot:TRINITY_DN10434_c0_g1_i1.p1 TRINITY_DN10434_c0_g1~~TRINITY_DN10434_c0_g1_i1.p1  ORF type:complete len:406 (+),score=95.06 TRINITY_DN10434_c0_g1_i1:50-1267(+)